MASKIARLADQINANLDDISRGIAKKPMPGPPKRLGEFELVQHSDEFNAGTKDKQQIHEEYNTARNLQAILDRIKAGTARGIEAEPRPPANTPFFLIGSGGGLDDTIAMLRDWKGGIFCSTSQALTLIYHGVEPTHIVALDPFSAYAEIAGIDWSKTRTKMVMHPGVWPDILEQWPNEVLLYRQDIGVPNSFYATTQMHMFCERTGNRDEAEFRPLIPTTVTQFACSPPAQLFIADRLGYGICFLTGMDFSYHTGKERFTEYRVRTEAKKVKIGNAPPAVIPPEWEKFENPFVMPENDDNQRDQNKICTTSNGQVTTQIGVYYKKNFISAWRLSRKTMYTTDHGSLVEVPYMDAKKVIATQGKAKPQKAKWICDVTEKYLAMSGAWVLETVDGGSTFIKSKQPELELNAWMVKMRQQCVCPNCGLSAVNETPDEPETKKCPRCEMANFKRKFEIDVPGNMKRIYDLVKYVNSRKR